MEAETIEIRTVPSPTNGWQRHSLLSFDGKYIEIDGEELWIRLRFDQPSIGRMMIAIEAVTDGGERVAIHGESAKGFTTYGIKREADLDWDAIDETVERVVARYCADMREE